jgi:chloride channel protein, CIC family
MSIKSWAWFKKRSTVIWTDFTSRENSFNLIMALIIGLIGGYGAVGFRWLIEHVELLCFGQEEPTVSWLLGLPWWAKLLVPTVGGLLVGPIVSKFAAEAKGHGVPEVMAAVARRGGIIKPRVAAAKVVASAITIGTGGSAGSEGPIVQIGSGISSMLGQFLHVSARRMKTFVGCGAAAGIAATFNAPVAGMIFAVEVILGDFGVAQLSPIIVASVVATAVSRAYLGDVTAFHVPEYQIVSAFEMIPYAVLGVAAAFVAVGFTITLDRSETWFENLKVPDWIKPAIGGLAIGLMGVAGLPHVFGVGYEFIEEALAGHLPLYMLSLLVIAKIVATSFTLGSGGSGGILAPSLFLGAMLGGVVWYGAHAISPDMIATNYGAYSLVGMAAVLAAATRAPLQAILILFELTGGYKVILPLMLASIFAVMIASILMKESIYTIKLKAKGIDLQAGKDVNVLSTVLVRAVMRNEMHTVSSGMRLQNLLEEISNTARFPTLFMVDSAGRLAGVISYPEIRRVLFDVKNLAPVLRAEDIASFENVAVCPDDNLDLVISNFARFNLDQLPVVEADDRTKLIGSILRTDVVDAYHSEVLKRDLMGGMNESMGKSGKVSSTSLAPGYAMTEIEIPAHWAGQNLKNLNLRAAEGIDVMLIKRHVIVDGCGSEEQIMPGPDLVLHSGDLILVSGKRNVIDRLSKT